MPLQQHTVAHDTHLKLQHLPNRGGSLFEAGCLAQRSANAKF